VNGDVEAVFALRRQYWENGYRPVAVWNSNIKRVHNPGKQPVGKEWEKAARQNPPRAAVVLPDPQALSTGILCDEVRCVDIDVFDFDLVEKIARLVEEKLGPGGGAHRATPQNGHYLPGRRSVRQGPDG
jgi:Bifunctional DNA primase/polymerase, N-terminal